MSAIAPVARSGNGGERASVGGSIIILNNYWGVRAYDWFKDESDLGLVMGVYIKLPHTKLLWMGAYWPVSAPTFDLADLTTSGRLAHRTKAFLTKKGYGTTTALEYVQGVISHFAACHRVKHPGSPVVVSGDFNSSGLELKKWSQPDGWV